MAFTTEAMAAVSTPIQGIEQNQLDLPSREFVGYDPKGTTTITGTPIWPDLFIISCAAA